MTFWQAYTGASDDEALKALVLDRRWPLVLDCEGAKHAPFGEGTLVRFRQALIARDLNRRLLERTVGLAARDAAREVGPRNLRAALDAYIVEECEGAQAGMARYIACCSLLERSFRAASSQQRPRVSSSWAWPAPPGVLA